MGEISVDLAAVGERQRQRLGEALYQVDALSVALEVARGEVDELRAEVERLRVAAGNQG